jgi:fructokinase
MIVSCGEALIDFLPAKTSAGRPASEPFPGGSPFNVAIAIGRLGSAAGFYGGLSTDLFGEMLTAALKAASVDVSLATVSERPTTLAFVVLADGNARYAFFDEGSAGRMLSETDLPALPKTVSALHFGSFSLAEEPCGSSFEALMRREFPDRVISLDVNVRPTLIKNRDGYLARIDRLAVMSDIVKLSDEDLAWLGSELSPLAEKWLKAGAKLIVLTRGDNGAVAISRHAHIEVPSVPAKVVDTIGAGDTFMAGLLVALDRAGLLTKDAVARLSDTQVRETLAFAARAAAITVSRAGADPPWARELT